MKDTRQKGRWTGGDKPTLQAMARVAALCNNAALVQDAQSWRVEGDPMEGALLAFAGKLGETITDRPRAEAIIPIRRTLPLYGRAA